MEVLQIIQGREAVPVRAIPFLTGWQKMSPDAVAQALAGMNHFGHFVGFTAYKLRTDGSIKKTLPQEWRIVALELEGIDATLKDTQTSHAAGTYAWRKQAISTLPAGVFVWRDELSEQYADSMRRTYHFDFDSSGQSFRAEPPELKFDIEVLLPQLEYLVLEGFAPAKAPPQAQQSPQETPAPDSAPAAPPEVVLMPSQAAPTAPAVAESWHLKKPERAHGYTWELYSVLKAARDAGKTCPKPREVLDSWQAIKPLNITEVMSNEFKYLDSNGEIKTADFKALRKAIYRMTSAR